MAIADRIVVMNAGRIEDAGPPDRVYRAPATLFAADFMGEMNHIPAEIRSGAARTVLGPFDAAELGPGAAMVCIRPEALRAGDAAGGIDLGHAILRDATFFGTHIRAHLVPQTDPDTVLVAHLPAGDLPRPGSILPLSVAPDAVRIYRQETPR